MGSFIGGGLDNALKERNDRDASGIDVVDTLWKRLDDLKKIQEDKRKTDLEYEDKLNTLDIDARYKGIGTVARDPKTGRATLTPYGPNNPAPYGLAPIAQGQAAYGAAISGNPLPSGMTPAQQAVANLPPIVRNKVQGQIAAQQAQQEQETKMLSDSQMSSINSYAQAIDQLDSLVQDMEENKYQTGPYFAGGKYGMGDRQPFGDVARARTFTPQESTFFGNSREVLSNYLKAQTGAQRGFQEVQFLLPAMPDTGAHTPDQFISVGKAASKRARQNLDSVLDYAEAAGYRNVDKIRGLGKNRFNTAEDAAAAYKAGKIKKGDTINIGGVRKKVQ